MGEKRGMKALEEWCRRVTEGYKDVRIENMSSSWRDGLAFCAIIHHFRPELINFDSLNKENILQNNEMAFSVAEKHLGIPALLEAEDMVKYKVPDKLSIMTYLSQFYQCFQGGGQAISPNKTTKRPLESSASSPSPDSPPGKVTALNTAPSLPQRHDVCQTCHHRVYILERLIIDSKLYHRMCFKCCRCQSVLKPGSYVEGQLPGEYECVSCPDEEAAESAAIATMAAARVAQQQQEQEQTSQMDKPRQPTYTSNLQLTSSMTDARRDFLLNVVQGDDDVEESDTSKSESSVKTNGEVSKDDDDDEKLSGKDDENVETKTKEIEIVVDDVNDNIKAPLAKPEDETSTPVPSPRARRKKKSSLTDTPPESDRISEDVFLTPESSPLPAHREPEAVLSTDEDKLEASPRGHVIKPIANVRLSRSSDGQNGSSNTSPSREGVIVPDMPVIQPRISRRVLSPPRVVEDVEESDGGQNKNLNLYRQPPPKPPRSPSIENMDRKKDVFVIPSPRRRTSLEGKVMDKNESGDELRSAKSDCPIQTTPKKVPPPRPQLPTILKQSAAKSSGDDKTKAKTIYPDDLNPFGDDDNNAQEEDTKTKSLNPFDSDEDEDEAGDNDNDKSTSIRDSPSTDSSVTPTKIKQPPPNSNPFGSDDDDDDDDEDKDKDKDKDDNSKVTLRTPTESRGSLHLSLTDRPMPLPRRSLDIRSTSVSPAGSVSKHSGQKYTGSYSANTSPAGSMSKASGSKYSTYHSHSSSTENWMLMRKGSKDSGLDISPTGSISRGFRKKRQAPKPPGGDGQSSSTENSPRSPSIRSKKSPAPPPPPPQLKLQRNSSSPTQEITEKTMKELDNLTLKSSGSDTAGTDQFSSPSPGQADETSRSIVSASTFGYWKKKKPAPPVPLPPKRQIVKLPLEEIQKELKKIEDKQLEMETQGVELEKAIREGCLDESEANNEDEESDNLVLELFDLVNQKNVLFRRQAELVYLRRQQKLEEEHAELEYQIRCLMGKPDASKTDEDRELEEELIRRLLEIVRQRNEIIESVENDRLREKIEDQSIKQQMALHQAGSSRTLLSSSSSGSLDAQKKKEKKKKKDKVKNKEKEKSKAIDEDKDLDDVEAAKEKGKKDKKRKWF